VRRGWGATTTHFRGESWTTQTIQKTTALAVMRERSIQTALVSLLLRRYSKQEPLRTATVLSLSVERHILTAILKTDRSIILQSQPDGLSSARRTSLSPSEEDISGAHGDIQCLCRGTAAKEYPGELVGKFGLQREGQMHRLAYVLMVGQAKQGGQLFSASTLVPKTDVFG
jgi:hypothetical protein